MPASQGSGSELLGNLLFPSPVPAVQNQGAEAPLMVHYILHITSVRTNPRRSSGSREVGCWLTRGLQRYFGLVALRRVLDWLSLSNLTHYEFPRPGLWFTSTGISAGLEGWDDSILLRATRARPLRTPDLGVLPPIFRRLPHRPPRLVPPYSHRLTRVYISREPHQARIKSYVCDDYKGSNRRKLRMAGVLAAKPNHVLIDELRPTAAGLDSFHPTLTPGHKRPGAGVLCTGLLVRR